MASSGGKYLLAEPLLLPEDVACNMFLVALQDAGPSESNTNKHEQSK
jgi:hypothetical protein